MDDLTNYMNVAIALAFVLALIGIAAWLFRRTSSKGKGSNGWFSHKAHRLGIVGASHIDSRRRLVLVRRDDVEHLLMLGGPVDIVVESGIAASTENGPPDPDGQPPRKEPIITGSSGERTPSPSPAGPAAPSTPETATFDPTARLNTIFQAAMQRASNA